MGKKQIIDINRIMILFLILFSIWGCTTAKKKTMPLSVPQQKEVTKDKSRVKQVMTAKERKIAAVKKGVKNKLTWDVIVFRDLRQIDLDKDGEKDILALYTPSLNCSGVKVIKVNEDKGEVIFKQIFITPHIKIKIKNGVPMIMVRDIISFDGLGARKIYLWNGRTFVPI